MTVSRSQFMQKIATAVAVLALTGTLAAGTAHGQKAEAIDQKAMQILQDMSDYLAKAKMLSFQARTFFDEVRKSGIKIKSARTVRVIMKRPNSLHALAIADSGAARSAWFDGAKLTVLMRQLNQVMELPFAGTTDGLLDELIENYEAQLPLVDLLYSDVGKNFKENIISAEYIGIKRVEGVACHHLSFESTGADWQIWIQADSMPVPRRFVISYVNAPEKPEFLAELDKWSIDGEAADYHFKAAVPDSAKKIPFSKLKNAQ